jgi:hypothetical protein
MHLAFETSLDNPYHPKKHPCSFLLNEALTFEIRAFAYLPFASFSNASFDLGMYLDVQTFLAFHLGHPWLQLGIGMKRQLGTFLRRTRLQMIRRTRWGQAEVAMMVMMVLLAHSPDWPIDNAHENQLDL